MPIEVKKSLDRQLVDHSSLARKLTATLLFAQSLGSAGFIAAATVNSIAGAQLSGNPALAGVPWALYLLGSAFAALAWGYLMEWIGRRGGLVIGMMFGAAGAGIAAKAIVGHSFLAFLGGSMLMGVGYSALQLARFAAAEVHPPAQHGRAISNVVIGGAVGAVFGPLLVGPTGRWALLLGFDELTGPFATAFMLFVLVSLLVYLRLRPDPRDLGREVARVYPEASPHSGPARSIGEILRQPAPLVAVTAMVFGQVVMVMLMVITALYMKGHQHTLPDISLVISSHTFGMFAFSIFSGRLADRWGREPVILTGLGTLILACLLTPLSSEVLPLAAALFLLGLGWNFCYVGGSSLLANHLSPLERARTQGFNDLLIGLASAIGSFGSGLVFAYMGYPIMGLFGAIAALLPLGMILWWQMSKRRLAMARRIS